MLVPACSLHFLASVVLSLGLEVPYGLNFRLGLLVLVVDTEFGVVQSLVEQVDITESVDMQLYLHKCFQGHLNLK